MRVVGELEHLAGTRTLASGWYPSHLRTRAKSATQVRPGAATVADRKREDEEHRSTMIAQCNTVM